VPLVRIAGRLVSPVGRLVSPVGRLVSLVEIPERQTDAGPKLEACFPHPIRWNLNQMSESEKKSEKPKTIRCEHPECRKKLGLYGFDCKCGKQFCGQHRAAEIHMCTFDYKNEGKKELLKYMSSPVLAAKIAVI
jgi:hypothetical protein